MNPPVSIKQVSDNPQEHVCQIKHSDGHLFNMTGTPAEINAYAELMGYEIISTTRLVRTNE